jgi:hypothetical protein
MRPFSSVVFLKMECIETTKLLIYHASHKTDLYIPIDPPPPPQKLAELHVLRTGSS